jgi:hypothetical protein
MLLQSFTATITLGSYSAGEQLADHDVPLLQKARRLRHKYAAWSKVAMVDNLDFPCVAPLHCLEVAFHEGARPSDRS